MQVEYKVYFDGERRPSQTGKAQATDMVREYLHPQIAPSALRELSVNGKVDMVNRRRGVRLVLTSLTKRVKVKTKSGKAKVFLKVKLDGIQTETQIKVAAADALKSKDGWHRTVCMVEANGLQYKVKCMHKGLTYTEAVHRCKVVEKKAL